MEMDGIRAQIVKRNESPIIWSRGEEVITDQYPEVIADVLKLKNCVIDGEIVAWGKDILPFSELQRRLGRKKVTQKILDEIPIKFLAFDCLEFEGIDIRRESYEVREKITRLAWFNPFLDRLEIRSKIEALDWNDVIEARAKSRSRKVEGVMIKSKSSPHI